MQLQDGRDFTGASDPEVHLAYLGQRLAKRVLPCCDPVRRLGAPAFGRWATVLAQDHTVSGKGQRRPIPVQAPTGGFISARDGNAVALAISKAQFRQPGQALGLSARAFGPVPDEQTDTRASLGIQLLARHQARYGAASVHPASSRLHMAVKAPVKFALQGEVEWPGQLPGYAAEIGNVPAPVMPLDTVAAAEQLNQAALAIDQGHRHAVHLWLNPDVLFTLHPGGHCLVVVQLADAGVGDRMRYRTAGTG
ncbi:hypothetical protein D3C77_462180 [compost metagenome]